MRRNISNMVIKPLVYLLSAFLILFAADISIENYKQNYKLHYNVVTATCYRAESNQCDDTPFITADNSVIDINNIDKLRWIAISRDLNEEYKMGDSVLVSGIDSIYDVVWIIHDRMNKRFNNKIDFLISKDLKAGLFKNVKIIKL